MCYTTRPEASLDVHSTSFLQSLRQHIGPNESNSSRSPACHRPTGSPWNGTCRPPLTSAAPGISSLSHHLVGTEEACVEDLTKLAVEINSLPGALVRFCE